MAFPRSAAFLTGTVLLLSGCTIGPGPRTPIQAFDGPVRQATEVSILNGGGFMKNGANLMETMWRTTVLEVDGKRIPEGTTDIELLPGDHTIKIACSLPYNSDVIETITITGKFAAGKRYWHNVQFVPMMGVDRNNIRRTYRTTEGRPAATCSAFLTDGQKSLEVQRFSATELSKPYAKIIR